jgi:hypothetical protein
MGLEPRSRCLRPSVELYSWSTGSFRSTYQILIPQESSGASGRCCVPIWSNAEDIRQETSTLPQPSNGWNGSSLRPCPQKTAQQTASGDVRDRTRCGSRSHLNHRKPDLHHRDPSPCKGKEPFTKVPKGSCARSDNFQRQVCGSAKRKHFLGRCSGRFDGQLERSELLSLYKIASPKQFTLRTRSAAVFGAAGNDRRCLPVPGNGHASGRYSSLAERQAHIPDDLSIEQSCNYKKGLCQHLRQCKV